MPKESANAQDLISIKEIRDNAVILKNGALRQIIMVGGINFFLKSETEQNVITRAYQDFLNALDFPIQTVIHSRKINIENYLNRLSEVSSQNSSPLLQDQTTEYIEFVRGFVQKNAIMEKTFLVVVPFTPLVMPGKESVSSLGKFLPFFKKNREEIKKKHEEEEVHFQENLEQLKQRVNQVIEGLLTIGLDTAVLNNEQLIELFYNYYNPEAVERKNIVVPKNS